jgi:hypothetical protein
MTLVEAAKIALPVVEVGTLLVDDGKVVDDG